MTDTSKEPPELLPCPFCGGDAGDTYYQLGWFISCKHCSASTEVTNAKARAVEAWNRRTPASQAQRVPLIEHEQALQLLAGLHPCPTIDGPPMALAELIFDAVQADLRALKDEIAKNERNLDWMRKELAKRDR